MTIRHKSSTTRLKLPTRWQRARYPLAALLCSATMLAALPLREVLDVANIDMLFLLTVFVTAVWLGRGPAVMAAFLGVALFDVFFVPPYLSFAVADAQYLITFGVMLAVGLITSHLVARLAERTELAQARERDTRILYELARDLGVALSVEHVAGIIADFLDGVGLQSTLLIADTANAADKDATAKLHSYGSRHLAPLELSFAHSAFERNVAMEADSLAGLSVAIAFLPLTTSGRVVGVLAVGPAGDDAEQVRNQRPLLEAIASLAAIIVERLHFAEAAQRSEFEIIAERLRTSILASLSHDLRTPLTSLVGLADSLAQEQTAGGGAAEGVAETAGIIRDQAHAMHHMLSNLLEMARLQAGEVTLNKVWQPFDEIVGSSTRLLANALASRTLEVRLAADLPLICFDAVLVERVVCNLLENAIKYSPAGSKIQLVVERRDATLEVTVKNAGAGFPPERIAQVFELFVRGEAETPVAGTGMGLAICKAIVSAHGGAIGAENLTDGACVRFTLPLGEAPTVTDEFPA